MKKLFLVPLFLFVFASGFAQVTLPSLIRDSMILQRDEKINLWGWASAQEKVNIAFNGKQYKAKANAAGKWLVQLPATKAGGPYTITISASNKITIRDILFGDVWLCSGQSNMVHQLNIHDVTYAKEIADADYPQIRQFWIPTLTSLQAPQNNLPHGYWKAAVGEEVRPFSAVAYFFAKKIHEQYKIPVGIINASVGGAPIEAWISEEGLKDFSSLKTVIEKNKDTAYVNTINRKTAPAAEKPARPIDAGLASTEKWSDINYTPKGWHNINIPGYWEDQGVKDLNGVVWYRREIELPSSMAGKSARVFLGRIVDTDELYINGEQVGNTGYQYPQRRYRVPAGLLKAGKNIFVIRVTNYSGKGGFVPDKPYCIFSGTDTVDLKGYWQYKVGAIFSPVAREDGGEGVVAQEQPAALYNAMLAPNILYRIKGICWYQGESNVAQPATYEPLLTALIKDWRTKWSAESLPFLYVQQPGFMDYNYLPSESNWALLREAQLHALAVPNTAMAVAIDLGEWNDIHPDNKKEVGQRLALAARKLVYRENIVSSGPIYASAVVEGSKIVISFTDSGAGLTTRDGEIPEEFAIAGADKKFVWATTKIENNKLIVWSDVIPSPKYVRYAWADNPVNPNLINKEGLPASPFRTDNQDQ